MKYFSPYIFQSKLNTCVLTDSKPCVQAVDKLARGEFLASPLVTSFLSTVSTHRYLGPVVQSVVSLTSSLRVISLTVLADSIHNILIFFAEKMCVAFALQKLLTFFQQKISAYLRITRCKF